jgi:F420H(2)-dependent quinone reductase
VNRVSVRLYRSSAGRLAGHGRNRLPVLLLTVPGRRTGIPHTVPVVYFEHDRSIVVVATGFNGAKECPQWFLNLRAAGGGNIHIQQHRDEMAARIATGAELKELWTQISRQAPHFAKWQMNLGRTFPVVLL